MAKNIRPYLNTAPQVDDSCYIDDMSVVIGDVVLAENVSVWPFAVIRGDVNHIRIGKNSNVQDHAMLHVSQISDEYINYDEKNSRLICQESKRFIGVNENIRARVVTLSLNEREPRDSKIGLTMRQSGLGTARWLEEDLNRELEKEKAEHGGR